VKLTSIRDFDSIKSAGIRLSLACFHWTIVRFIACAIIIKNEEVNMVEVSGKDELFRIEDFIALAKEGKDVAVAVDLRKQAVSQKVHPGDTEESKGELDMYLLFGDYTFRIGSLKKLVSKVYMYGSTGESLSDAKINKSIANERLKMDYQRLKNANIHFEEKYF
jgi:hypothetical protein